MATSLEALKEITQVIADTADFVAIKPYSVQEATTNPIIILQSASLPQYKNILHKAVQYGQNTGRNNKEVIENTMDMINVLFGEEILKVVKYRVHIQLDPRLAFNISLSVERALKIVKMFSERGIDKNHVVIKLPSTWEGIQAANILEKNHHVNCNMTTMFSLTQTAACAEAGVSYLAPFVGRISLWYKEKSRETGRHEGVEILKTIQTYLRKFDYRTKVMGAYFINAEEVGAVAGCDLATLPVALLEDFAKNNHPVTDEMAKDPKSSNLEKLVLDEARFRWLMNEDEMATELLAEILGVFSSHYIELENIVKEMVKLSK
ncbi:unnamed protein product [Diabrotica balteata]|uniref:Transaldolase n=1 Tax=Diabrotica balteata TaxID=107213 RepID=A0A9N9XAN4_DIABA|nr:unnamed protein product [Diabrotica balteata]